MRIMKYPTNEELREFTTRANPLNDSVLRTTGEILSQVRTMGDAALRELTQTFDGPLLDTFEVRAEEFEEAKRSIPAALAGAIQRAKQHIEAFHCAQREDGPVIETAPGVRVWRRGVPIASAGLYAPAGTAPLFSTLLMLAIPARIAGVPELLVCTPPDRNGKAAPIILFVASLLGIDRVFKVGGAQAIGAMAYGTTSIPKVAKIAGPGNSFVTCAKQLVQEEGIAIDMPAGPSEVLIVADEGAPPRFLAADLLAQAEHGPDSTVILIASSERLIEETLEEVAAIVEGLPRRDLAKKSLSRGAAILVSSLEEGMRISNDIAPEHLILATKEPKALAPLVQNAGSVFLGYFTPEAAGDYASGTNHVLPTSGYARTLAGLSVDSFIKKVTFQELSREGAASLSETVRIMAEAEGLNAHALSMTLRGNAQ